MRSAELSQLAALFFGIAALYASVGFGGGSSYLAILSLYFKDFLAIKTTGLICNLVVVSGGTFLFSKAGYFDKKRFLPFVLSGVPAAFCGALVKLEQQAFFILLGAVLALSGMLLLLQSLVQSKPEISEVRTPLALDILIGAGIGALSGLVGIGGGILLSPLLNLIRWGEARKIAALAAFFILVNSIAGLTGQLVSGTLAIRLPMLPVLLAAVFLGGQLGTRISLRAVKPAMVKVLTGVLVCYIGLKLMLRYTHGINI